VAVFTVNEKVTKLVFWFFNIYFKEDMAVFTVKNHKTCFLVF
jgi:hypothetical protein